MKLLIALFALFVSIANAQESYVDSEVSTTNVTATTVQAGAVSATGRVTAGSGSSGAPAIGFGQNAGMGINRVTLDQMGFYTNSTERMRVTNGGLRASGAFVGDTGANPVFTLQVTGTFVVSGTGQTSTPTLAVNINNSGRVGIGTLSPSTPLDVIGLISSTGLKASGIVTATFFEGDGSRLANLPSGGSPSWYNVTSIPAYVQNVSNSSALFLTGLGVNGTITATTISSTYLYANQASATTTYTGSIKEGVVTLNASSGTTLFTFGAGSVVSGTISANTTISFTSPATGQANQLTWYVTQDSTGGRTINYPSNVKWNGNTSPTLTTNSNTTSILTFQTINGGVSVIGAMVATGVSP